MFCADYIMAFVYHTIFTSGAVYMLGSDSKNKKKQRNGETNDINNDLDRKMVEDSDHNERRIQETLLQVAISALGLNSVSVVPSISELKAEGRSQWLKDKSAAHPLCFGVASGLATSITLYPFDFVRGGVLPPGLKRVLSSGSTVPYAGVLFGMYFR